MKRNRPHLFITITSLALATVLIIQVNWIIQTAKMKEELFNEKANMVLSKTAEGLSSDTAAFRKMVVHVNRNEANRIDSLFNHYMKRYNIHIDYSFEAKSVPLTDKTVDHPASKFYQSQPGSYKTCIGAEDNKNALELKLFFPKKEQFILAEMGLPFITSVLLILVVLITSWQTILSLRKEKKIAAHTRDFLNNMTHEFKTPLTNISLAGKMILKDLNGPANKVKHYSEIILEENEKLSYQVEQVLSMTALERGEIPLKKMLLDFHQLIHDALNCLTIQIENKQGQIKSDLEAKQFILSGDKTHLSNALCNLIENALKYSKEQPQLFIQTANDNQHLIIKVTDKGIGIEKEYQKKVFEKFFRVSTGDVHEVKGFGLGLAYTKKIFELHSGTIELQSEKGVGSTFTITLPHA
jgi:two-component system phosphate regulon sensor histidine kinase PhoR